MEEPRIDPLQTLLLETPMTRMTPEIAPFQTSALCRNLLHAADHALSYAPGRHPRPSIDRAPSVPASVDIIGTLFNDDTPTALEFLIFGSLEIWDLRIDLPIGNSVSEPLRVLNQRMDESTRHGGFCVMMSRSVMHVSLKEANADQVLSPLIAVGLKLPTYLSRGVNANCLMLQPCADVRGMAQCNSYFIGGGEGKDAFCFEHQPNFEREHPGGDGRLPTSHFLPSTPREDLRLDGYSEQRSPNFLTSRSSEFII
ncbi:hypothetical protein TNCV_831181 [Trichonephila clavipes]|nr:hypothetical protein TNCV_831181 [Trichonephila clavipes]